MSCSPATLGSLAPADIDVLDKVRSLDIPPRAGSERERFRSPYGGGRAPPRCSKEPRIRVADARVARTATGNGYDLNLKTRRSQPLPRWCWATF